jgi:predicted Zn-dependent protease
VSSEGAGAIPLLDHYALLEVAPDATPQAIQDAIRRERRTWSRRAGLADAALRGQAEERIRRLADAERVLLDGESRARFDAERVRLSRPSPRPRPRIVGAAPDEAMTHAERADGYARAGAWPEALREYQAASRLRPDVVRFRAGAGTALLHLGETGRALELLETVVRQEPDDPGHQQLLAQALRASAHAELSVRADGSRTVTSPAQIEVLRQLTIRALALDVDGETRRALTSDLAAADAAERTVWTTTGLPGWVVLLVLALLPVVLVSVWFVPLPVLVVAAFAASHRRPAWRVDARRDDIVERGL